jgi:hypothetical protein
MTGRDALAEAPAFGPRRCRLVIIVPTSVADVEAEEDGVTIILCRRVYLPRDKDESMASPAIGGAFFLFLLTIDWVAALVVTVIDSTPVAA